jgi:hypothetical protein
MRKLVGTLMLASAVACGGDAPTDPSTATIAGVYTLRTIGGLALPYEIGTISGVKYEFVDDAFTIVEGGTYAELGHGRATVNGTATIELISNSGTYTRNKTAITFAKTGGSSFGGVVENGTLTLMLTGNGVPAIFTK